MHSPLPVSRCWMRMRSVQFVNERHRLSHFHMNNIGHCVSHECLSFIPIPPANIFCTNQTVHIFHAFGFIAVAARTAVGLSSRIFLSTTHQTYRMDGRKKERKKNETPAHNSPNIVYRVQRFPFVWANVSNVFRCSVCFDWNRRGAANPTANSQLF